MQGILTVKPKAWLSLSRGVAVKRLVLRIRLRCGNIVGDSVRVTVVVTGTEPQKKRRTVHRRKDVMLPGIQ